MEEVHLCFGVVLQPLLLGCLESVHGNMKLGDYRGLLEQNVALSVMNLRLCLKFMRLIVLLVYIDGTSRSPEMDLEP